VTGSVLGVSDVSVKMLSSSAPGPQAHRVCDGTGALLMSRGTFVPRLPIHAPVVKSSGVRKRYSDLWCSSFPAPLRDRLRERLKTQTCVVLSSLLWEES